MVKSSVACSYEWTAREPRWPYDEYYIGNRDQQDRKNGKGENHWTGAESIEWYTGQFLRDTMHGEGDYRWRHQDPDGAFTTYEGRFFANQMHGYGTMSYADGCVFSGLFYKDVRWGPGVSRTTGLRYNIGFWRGNQLVRLTWCLPGPSLTPDFNSGPKGPSYLDQFRVVLAKNTRIVGQTNSALELLKKHGCDPQPATQLWPKLYPETCNDLESALCYRDAFDRAYYKGKVRTLEEVNDRPAVAADAEVVGEDDEENNENTENVIKKYFAWNNNEMMRHMMKHCYQHESQRERRKVDLERILNGPRKTFRLAGKHEYDSRTLLMASYLGHITNVAQLVNNAHVYPDISDMQGNTALMYAVCGDQNEIIHFLVEAGANVDSYNDSCCTPLCMALIRYLCVALELSPTGVVQALLPPAPPKADKTVEERKAAEWLISRENICKYVIEPAKLAKTPSVKKMKSTGSLGKSSTTAFKKKAPGVALKSRTSITVPEYNSDDEVFTEDKRVFKTIYNEYEIRVNSLFMSAPLKSNVVNIFEVNDMMKDIEAEEEFMRMLTTTEKNPKKSVSKTQKDNGKNKEIFDNTEKDFSSMTSGEKLKSDVLTKIQLTMTQLFADGADPKKIRCPQPAILLAIKTGSPELVKDFVAHGADINEKFPEFLDYTALDIVISEPFSLSNIEMIRALLELGADVVHRLKPAEILQSASVVADTPGPTLMHAVLAKRTEFETEEDLRDQTLELLLRHNADPIAQYNGRSPIDIAMIKRIELLDVFIKSGSNLNTIINDKNQTILIKMFSEDYYKNSTLGNKTNRIPVLTNLLLYGADPLIECYDEEERFGNVFEYAKKTLNVLAPTKQTVVEDSGDKGAKGKNGKDPKPKPSKEKTKSATDINKKKGAGKDSPEILPYTESLDLMRECARLLHIRWLQAKLVKELINVIYQYKHRPWNMIIKEHGNGSNVGLWLTTLRCLEIWEVLKTTKRKQYNNERILKHLLCIVQFYQKRLKAKLSPVRPMTATEKNIIESDVGCLIKEHKNAAALAKEAEAWKKLYAKPELDYKADNKFQVCFECSLRLTEESIICDNCNLVSFCNLECLHSNIDRANCHPVPCCDFLKEMYFSPVE